MKSNTNSKALTATNNLNQVCKYRSKVMKSDGIAIRTVSLYDVDENQAYTIMEKFITQYKNNKMELDQTDPTKHIESSTVNLEIFLPDRELWICYIIDKKRLTICTDFDM